MGMEARMLGLHPTLPHLHLPLTKCRPRELQVGEADHGNDWGLDCVKVAGSTG